MKENFVGPDQVILDVGINVDENGTLCGDVAFEAVEPEVSVITPVPGGVGGVTTAVLAAHVVDAAEQAAGVSRTIRDAPLFLERGCIFLKIFRENFSGGGKENSGKQLLF